MGRPTNRPALYGITFAILLVVVFLAAVDSVQIADFIFWIIAIALFIVVVSVISEIEALRASLSVRFDETYPGIYAHDAEENGSDDAIARERRRVVRACREPLRELHRNVYLLVAGVLVGWLIWSAADRNRRVADFQNWREGVIQGAADRSRGGGCGTVVREYFDDLGRDGVDN